jgi:hypothetical protein
MDARLLYSIEAPLQPALLAIVSTAGAALSDGGARQTPRHERLREPGEGRNAGR